MQQSDKEEFINTFTSRYVQILLLWYKEQRENNNEWTRLYVT